MRRTMKLLLASAIAGVLAGTVAVQAPAAASSSDISGTIDPWGDWEWYTNIRTTYSGTVTLQPSNLIYQAGNYSTLNIKLMEIRWTGGYASYYDLGSPQLWVNAYDRRTLVTGAPSGTQFIILACCRATSDMAWAGNLTW